MVESSSSGRIDNSELTCWLSSDAPEALAEVSALCFGTGRFLRSVLVPALVGAYGGNKVALIQARGCSMMKYMASRQSSSTPNTYEIDTVLPDGTIDTALVPCCAAFSVGTDRDKRAFVEALPHMKNGISVLGIGVTEAGLASKETQVMKDLFELFHLMCVLEREGKWNSTSNNKICVIDMDNIPNNGQLLEQYMMELAVDDEEMRTFFRDRVVFCDTMVDRITSQRPNSDGMVPRCEPTPAKALVICDPNNDLPRSSSSPEKSALAEQKGVVVRSSLQELQIDIALKLRIANGTHTAIAHTLALLKHTLTDVLSQLGNAVFMRYLDAMAEHQIVVACSSLASTPEKSASMKQLAMEAWEDWRTRLVHPYFGLSSFFITQNGTAKGGIRWGPTVIDLVSQHQTSIDDTAPLQVSTAFAYATLLRWLTPLPQRDVKSGKAGVYVGWLDGTDPMTLSGEFDTNGAVEYADGMSYNLDQGWYEYKCPLQGLVTKLQACYKKQPSSCLPAIRDYLTNAQGGNLTDIANSSELDDLAGAISVLYARMLAGDGLMTLLKELDEAKLGVGFTSPCAQLAERPVPRTRPLHYQAQSIPNDSKLMTCVVDIESLPSVVTSEVKRTMAIDLHTHLLPPSHGTLCLWGIDELLTYHYLVAEYFITAPASMVPADFYALTKREQADLIWKALFVDRSPLSEACRGVLTTLQELGLEKEIVERDLDGIRRFYQKYRDDGVTGAESFCERAFANAGLEYAVMTNIPFESKEAQYWRPEKVMYSKRYRSALRVDPLLAGDKPVIEAALKASGYDCTLEGARQYLRDWCDTMKPEYMMASTPHDFVLREGTIEGSMKKTGLNEQAMSQPGAFADAGSIEQMANCDTAEDGSPSIIDENSDFLSEVLMKVCEERDLPVALKIGARRGLNPSLQAAGDGMVAFADAGVLARLCTRFPKVRFLATFLSRNNQHEACVLANKFRNLHIYGCWWYCNNPSIIREITKMRVEMLGTAFTVQHSDARVVDQLVYKWSHARSIVAQVLTEEYSKAIESGWQPSRAEIRRDVRRLFRGSYEEFMGKSLA